MRLVINLNNGIYLQTWLCCSNPSMAVCKHSLISEVKTMRQPETLHIALFTYSTKPRGSVVHTLELAEALQKLGHQVCVYALDKDGTGFYRQLCCPYKLVHAQPVVGGIDALIEQRIQEFVDYLSTRSQIYDCYHAQDCISANALDRLKQSNQIPHFIRTVHHIEDFNSPYLQNCQDLSIRHPDFCLCVSAKWQAELREKYQIEAPTVTNGVNSQRFSTNRNGLCRTLLQCLLCLPPVKFNFKVKLLN